MFSATEESKEADAFGNFLTERREVVQVRNKKCAVPDGPWTLNSELCRLTSDLWLCQEEKKRQRLNEGEGTQEPPGGSSLWYRLSPGTQTSEDSSVSDVQIWDLNFLPDQVTCDPVTLLLQQSWLAAPQRRSLPIETNLYFYIRKDFILLFSCSSFCRLLFVKHWHWLRSAK